MRDKPIAETLPLTPDPHAALVGCARIIERIYRLLDVAIMDNTRRQDESDEFCQAYAEASDACGWLIDSQLLTVAECREIFNETPTWAIEPQPPVTPSAPVDMQDLAARLLGFGGAR